MSHNLLGAPTTPIRGLALAGCGSPVSRPSSSLPACPRFPVLPHMLGGKALPQPHEKPFPRGVPTPGKAGRAPSAVPPRGWNTGRDQCGRRGVATLFQSGSGAFRWGPCPAPTLVLPDAAGDPQEPQPRARATSSTQAALPESLPSSASVSPASRSLNPSLVLRAGEIKDKGHPWPDTG